MDTFHRAIYGVWAEHPRENRIQTRIELVEVLGKFGQRTQAQAELLTLMGEMPEDAAIGRQVGTLLLAYGLPKQSAEVFRRIIQQTPRDGDAHAGLGEAAFALDDFRSAEAAFKSALHWKPEAAAFQQRLELIEQILSLDPNLRGLKAAERYQRSRKLMEKALGALDSCMSAREAPVPAAAAELAESARKQLLMLGRPSSYSDATETALAYAEQLWKAHADLCGMPASANEALRNILSRLIK